MYSVLYSTYIHTYIHIHLAVLRTWSACLCLCLSLPCSVCYGSMLFIIIFDVITIIINIILPVVPRHLRGISPHNRHGPMILPTNLEIPRQSMYIDTTGVCVRNFVCRCRCGVLRIGGGYSSPMLLYVWDKIRCRLYIHVSTLRPGSGLGN